MARSRLSWSDVRLAAYMLSAGVVVYFIRMNSDVPVLHWAEWPWS